MKDQGFLSPWWSDAIDVFISLVTLLALIVALGAYFYTRRESQRTAQRLQAERRRVSDLTTLRDLVVITNQARNMEHEDAWWVGYALLRSLSQEVSEKLRWNWLYYDWRTEGIQEALGNVGYSGAEPGTAILSRTVVFRVDHASGEHIHVRSVQAVMFDELIDAIGNQRDAPA